MNRSTNFNFYLPENSDIQDVSQLSYNFEIIDTRLGEQAAMENLGAFTDVTGLSSTLSTVLGNLGNFTSKSIRFNFTTASGIFKAISYYGILRRGSSASYADLMVTAIQNQPDTVIGVINNGTWVFEKAMTLAETAASTGALASIIAKHAATDAFAVNCSATLISSLIGATTSLVGTAVIRKASADNAYYFAFSRDYYAIGNIAVNGGAVTIKYTSSRLSITNQSSTADAVNVPNNANTEITSINLDEGHYLIIFHATWASNATGFREIWASESSGGARLNLASDVNTNAVNGDSTRQQLTVLYRASENAVLHFVAKQNSGAALSLNPRYSIMRIK